MRARRARRSLPGSIAGSTAILIVLSVDACGSTPATPSPAAVSLQPSTVVPSTPSPSPAGLSSAGPGAAASPAVDHDPTLLSILPAAIGGASVTDDPESLTTAAGNRDFAANVQSAAYAVVVDGGDLASALVARLRPGAYSDAFYRDWRDTYNQGACAQAGGVVGNAEAELGGRTVHITSCAGGLLVYHAYLPERDVVISLFSLGDRRFGEQLMRGLRP